MITDTDTDTRSTDINWQQILKDIKKEADALSIIQPDCVDDFIQNAVVAYIKRGCPVIWNPRVYWRKILRNIAINEWRHYSSHVVFVDNPIYIEGSYSSDVNVEQLVCTREIFQYPEAQQLLQMYFKNGDNHTPVSILGERRNHSMLTPVPARKRVQNLRLRNRLRKHLLAKLA